MAKVKLDARLEPEVAERLKAVSALRKISISDLIANALDAQEREEQTPELIVDRVQNIEENLSSLINLINDFSTIFSEKMQDAGVHEKERLKSLLLILEKRIQEHDQAEEARFLRIKPPTF